MDFNFSKEEKLLQNSAREYTRNKIVPVVADEDLKAPLAEKEVRDYLKDLVDLGYVGSLVAEKDGGPGLSHVETGIIFHEIGRVWAALGAIAAATSGAISLFSKAKNFPGSEEILDNLMNAKSVGCVAVTEPLAGTDFTAIKTMAIPDRDDYIVNGVKTWVSNGSVADVVLVAVKLENGGEKGECGLLFVDKKASPFDALEIPKMGLKGLSTAQLHFDNCRVPKENLLIFDENGAPFEKSMIPQTSCEKVAIALGLVEAALETGVSYAKQRVQFESPLAKFQMIQKMIAETAIGLDAGKLLFFRAMKMLDDGENCSKELAMADAFATQTAVEMTSKTIQIHGGYGYSVEYPVERFYRDAQCFSVMEGTKQIRHLEISHFISGINGLV